MGLPPRPAPAGEPAGHPHQVRVVQLVIGEAKIIAMIAIGRPIIATRSATVPSTRQPPIQYCDANGPDCDHVTEQDKSCSSPLLRPGPGRRASSAPDRKSTRLKSSNQ